MMPKLDRTAQTDQHGSAAARRTSNVLLGVLYSNCEISSIFEGQDHVALSQQWRPSDLQWRPNMTAVATNFVAVAKRFVATVVRWFAVAKPPQGRGGKRNGEEAVGSRERIGGHRVHAHQMSQKGQGNHLSKMIMMATKHLAGTSGTSSPAIYRGSSQGSSNPLSLLISEFFF